MAWCDGIPTAEQGIMDAKAAAAKMLRRQKRFELPHKGLDVGVKEH